MVNVTGKKALVFGSTGFIGSKLVNLLQQDKRYSEIIVYNRRKTGVVGQGVKEVVVDFDNLKEKSLSGDHCYIAIGTTIKKVKNRDVFRNVDFGVPAKIASSLSKNIQKVVAITSMGAWPDAPNFYLRIKGEVEEELGKVLGDKAFFLRPSILMGKRNEFRPPEEVGKAIMKILGPLFVGPLKKFKGIDGRVVAAAMIHSAFAQSIPQVIESDVINELGREYLKTYG
jgi:uncharacterized protein YbjT (DUF2867 family)